LKEVENKKNHWAICPNCQGCGKKYLKLRKHARLRYQIAMEEYKKNQLEKKPCTRPKITQYLCENCKGSGLISSPNCVKPDNVNLPHVAIIGAGIGGTALAVACLHRGIPFTIYERDSGVHVRSQGYGLTLQQASNAVKGFGLFSLKDTSNSTRHVVLSTDGKEIVEWGRRTHLHTEKPPKRTNVHIPRQSLRQSLLEQLEDSNCVQWGHQLIHFQHCEDNTIELTFKVNDEIAKHKTDLLVGADGIRSVVRNILIGEKTTPLRYLGYMVILGICPLHTLKNIDSSLLDLTTVFQTVNGCERIYVMPYSSDSVMWQFSYPLAEEDAKKLSTKGSLALKEEVCRRAQWHTPVPEILSTTPLSLISGYPVYDRQLLQPEMLFKAQSVTLIGDAAHPMSPFKGQGANQALLDALSLARKISTTCHPSSNWRELGLRNVVLTEFEEEMIERSSCKVKDSAKAVELLHSKSVLREGNGPKDRIIYPY
jgi:salicylate hydroxylase